jgi:hypothetical protein
MDSNLAKEDGIFLMAVKTSNTISFGGEVKLSVPCQQDFMAC